MTLQQELADFQHREQIARASIDRRDWKDEYERAAMQRDDYKAQLSELQAKHDEQRIRWEHDLIKLERLKTAYGQLEENACSKLATSHDRIAELEQKLEGRERSIINLRNRYNEMRNAVEGVLRDYQ